MNNKKIVPGVLLALVVVASGCTSSAESKTPKSDTKVEPNTSLKNDEEIRKVTFKDDGETINCYIYDQDDPYGGKGGMSCIPDRISSR